MLEYGTREESYTNTLDTDSLDAAIQNAQDHLLSLQSEEGYWMGELEADASVTAGYIPIMYFWGIKISQQRINKIINFLKDNQNEDGSWSAYRYGPGDISVSVQVYFALKLAGISPEEDFMQKARNFIVSSGGVTETNVITRIWLSIFGQHDWQNIPTVPPEMIFFPRHFYFNIYEFSSWARATIMALAILSSNRPVCRVPDWASVAELYVNAPSRKRKQTIGWGYFFVVMDKLLKLYERIPLKPGRKLALKKVEEWVVQHQDADGSWGGIMLPWLYSLFALKSLGYGVDHPVVARGIEGLEDFIVEDEDTLRLQPAVSPVWDTAWAVLSLRESGLPENHPSLLKAARWLLKKEIRVPGDWRVKNPKAEPGCWAFEFENDYYPDIDDTSVVPRALESIKFPDKGEECAKEEAIRRGMHWVVSMQSNNGGWAAFDRNNNKRLLGYIPFSDFITPLDPVSADVTNHAIELLSTSARSSRQYYMAVSKGLNYFRRSQEEDGAWYGRWGVNYLYGTGLVLPALRAAGEDMSQEYIQKAVRWLKQHQNGDGGWGETCHTYDDPDLRGHGPSTASQTAWALIGLLATGEEKSTEAQRGINYLLQTQDRSGSWKENAFTGTGFPGAFYLRYELYKIYFPLMALSRFKRAIGDNHQNAEP